MPDTIGYCTNVHPGNSLAEICWNLENRVRLVRELAGCSGTMSCGLWLNETVAAELAASPEQVAGLRDRIAGCGLAVRSLNGFPMGDFHGDVVKHAVYHPTWAEPARLEYTRRLAGILAGLLDGQNCGTISTLPLGWGKGQQADFFRSCARQLQEWAGESEAVFQRTGKRIRLAIEPEPGCCLDRAADVAEFFRKYLGGRNAEVSPAVLNAIGVCHDICHSAVMFEPQGEALGVYRQSGISVWKVQVSAALEARFPAQARDCEEVARALAAFAEPRFLHQTSTSPTELYPDLEEALRLAPRTGTWRIHFHVPVFLDSIGSGLRSTQGEIHEFIGQFGGPDEVDWEIETYAWSVLPAELQSATLEEGIAGEVRWLDGLIQQKLPGRRM